MLAHFRGADHIVENLRPDHEATLPAENRDMPSRGVSAAGEQTASLS